jgi:hypothetical protein
MEETFQGEREKHEEQKRIFAEKTKIFRERTAMENNEQQQQFPAAASTERRRPKLGDYMTYYRDKMAAKQNLQLGQIQPPLTSSGITQHQQQALNGHTSYSNSTNIVTSQQHERISAVSQQYLPYSNFQQYQPNAAYPNNSNSYTPSPVPTVTSQQQQFSNTNATQQQQQLQQPYKTLTPYSLGNHFTTQKGPASSQQYLPSPTSAVPSQQHMLTNPQMASSNAPSSNASGYNKGSDTLTTHNQQPFVSTPDEIATKQNLHTAQTNYQPSVSSSGITQNPLNSTLNGHLPYSNSNIATSQRQEPISAVSASHYLPYSNLQQSQPNVAYSSNFVSSPIPTVTTQQQQQPQPPQQPHHTSTPVFNGNISHQQQGIATSQQYLPSQAPTVTSQQQKQQPNSINPHVSSTPSIAPSPYANIYKKPNSLPSKASSNSPWHRNMPVQPTENPYPTNYVSPFAVQRNHMQHRPAAPSPFQPIQTAAPQSATCPTQNSLNGASKSDYITYNLLDNLFATSQAPLDFSKQSSNNVGQANVIHQQNSNFEAQMQFRPAATVLPMRRPDGTYLPAEPTSNSILSFTNVQSLSVTDNANDRSR